MKQNITIEDLKSRSDSQKTTIRSMWLPALYDRVVATVCVDAENDIYEDLVFVVGEVILNNGTQIVLKRLRLLEEMVVDEGELLNDTSEFSEDESFDINDPGDYFLKENCLPLLNIGQLISFLRNTREGQSGFSIGIPPLNDRLEQGFTV